MLTSLCSFRKRAIWISNIQLYSLWNITTLVSLTNELIASQYNIQASEENGERGVLIASRFPFESRRIEPPWAEIYIPLLKLNVLGVYFPATGGIVYLRKKLLEIEDAHQIMNEAIEVMRGAEYEVSSCSAYDCEFISLTVDLKVPLVTVDQQILAQFPTVAIALDRFIEEES